MSEAVLRAAVPGPRAGAEAAASPRPAVRRVEERRLSRRRQWEGGVWKSAPRFAPSLLLPSPPPPPLARELQPPLYQPLTLSQYVSRWRPMRDRCFNIGSALIYSSCRSAPFSYLLSSAALSRSLPASRPAAPVPSPAPRKRRFPRPRSLITLYQKLILFVQFIDQPRWRRLCGAALVLLLAPGGGPLGDRSGCARPPAELYAARSAFTAATSLFFIGLFFCCFY